MPLIVDAAAVLLQQGRAEAGQNRHVHEVVLAPMVAFSVGGCERVKDDSILSQVADATLATTAMMNAGSGGCGGAEELQRRQEMSWVVVSALG